MVGEYIDRAYSAKTDRRPDFQRMIKDSAKRSFNPVIVWKPDRFARNRYDSAHYKTLLKKNGVKVMSATERISDGAEGILLESVPEGMAEYHYYKCVSAKKGTGCRRKAVKKDWIESAVVMTAKSRLDDSDFIDAVVRGFMEMQTAENTVIPHLRHELGEVIRSIDNMLNAYIRSLLTISVAVSRTAFIRRIHSVWSAALRCSVIPSLSASSFTSRKSISSACSLRSARYPFSLPDIRRLNSFFHNHTHAVRAASDGFGLLFSFLLTPLPTISGLCTSERLS